MDIKVGKLYRTNDGSIIEILYEYFADRHYKFLGREAESETLYVYYNRDGKASGYDDTWNIVKEIGSGD